MLFPNAKTNESGFTVTEILIAMGLLGIFAGALLTTWTALGTSVVNTTAYAERQNDQMRVFDYLKRDIRRAASIEIYSGGVLVTGLLGYGMNAFDTGLPAWPPVLG